MKLMKLITNWMGWFSSKADSSGSTPVQLGARGQSEELCEGASAAQKMRWGVVGMNGKAFVQTSPVGPDAPRLSERLRALPSARLHTSIQRDLASALELAVKVVTERPAQRYGVVYLIAGRPSSSEDRFQEAIQFAVESGVTVHGIYLGSDSEAEAALERVCTKPHLRFGSFHTVVEPDTLVEIVARCMKGLIAPPWLKRFNRTVFIVDFTEEMAQPLGNTSRIHACAEALLALTEPWQTDAGAGREGACSQSVWQPGAFREQKEGRKAA